MLHNIKWKQIKCTTWHALIKKIKKTNWQFAVVEEEYNSSRHAITACNITIMLYSIPWNICCIMWQILRYVWLTYKARVSQKTVSIALLQAAGYRTSLWLAVGKEVSQARPNATYQEWIEIHLESDYLTCYEEHSLSDEPSFPRHSHHQVGKRHLGRWWFLCSPLLLWHNHLPKT